MKLLIEIDDNDVRRVCPCDKNGEHDHAACIRAWLTKQLLSCTAQFEFDAMQERFKKEFSAPSISVTDPEPAE